MRAKIISILVGCLACILFFCAGFLVRSWTEEKEKVIKYKVTILSVVDSPLTVSLPNGAAEFTFTPFKHSKVSIKQNSGQ